jgi:hypothetical protein
MIPLELKIHHETRICIFDAHLDFINISLYQKEEKRQKKIAALTIQKFVRNYVLKK